MTAGILRAAVRRRLDEEGGATAVEYALLAALIAGVIVAVVTTLGSQIVALFNLLVGAF